MIKTKQAAHGGSSSRPTGMATARFGDEVREGKFEDISEDEWPDIENPPPQAAGVGESSKSTGKEGEGSKPVGKPTPQAEAEGGVTAPPEGDPTDKPQEPQAGTSTAAPQDPTGKPQDPQAGTSTDDPGLKEYVDSYMQAAQVWFDNIQETKINAYKMLYDTLLTLGKPHIKGLDIADITAILASIADKSGQFISDVDQGTVYISKEDETITQRTPATVSQDAKKSMFQSTIKWRKTWPNHKLSSCREPGKFRKQ